VRVHHRRRVQKLQRLQTSIIQIQNTVPAPAPAPAPATCTCKLPSWSVKMLKRYLLELNQDTFGTRKTLAGRVKRHLIQAQSSLPPASYPPPPAPCPLPPTPPCTCPYTCPLPPTQPPAVGATPTCPASCLLPPATVHPPPRTQDTGQQAGIKMKT
jgi:hypothetical protein